MRSSPCFRPTARPAPVRRCESARPPGSPTRRGSSAAPASRLACSEVGHQERKFAQSLPGAYAVRKPLEAGKLFIADVGRHDAIARGLVQEKEYHDAVAQGLPQSPDHTSAHVGLVKRGGELRAQPEQGGLSPGLGPLGRQQLFPCPIFLHTSLLPGLEQPVLEGALGGRFYCGAAAASVSFNCPDPNTFCTLAYVGRGPSSLAGPNWRTRCPLSSIVPYPSRVCKFAQG